MIDFSKLEEKMDQLIEAVRWQSETILAIESDTETLYHVIWHSVWVEINTDVTTPLKINGNVLDIDYRTWSLFNVDKMTKCIIVKEEWNIETKYTQWDNLTDEEREYFKNNWFILVDTNKKGDVTWKSAVGLEKWWDL